MEQILINPLKENLLKVGVDKEKRNDFSQAIDRYEMAINTDETNYFAYYSLGNLYEKLNNVDKAKEVYIKGINLAKARNDKSAETNLSFTLLGLMELTL